MGPIEQSAQDTWNSTGFLFGGPLPYNTGIANSWRDLYMNQQTVMPPPSTREFQSVDWSGNPIIVQIFASTRCEWNIKNARATWLPTGVVKATQPV